MSDGMSWACEEIEEEIRAKTKAKFDALTPYDAERVYNWLKDLTKESMSRDGHAAVDNILKKLNGGGV